MARKGNEARIPAFAIAKYPLTNAQFQVFVDDKHNGYSNPDWWSYSMSAWFWRAYNTPLPTAFDGDDTPRTNVCWYEAVAYCNWLTAQTGQPIGLPTEGQWQRAAYHRRYIGGEFPPIDEPVNVDYRVGRTTPVEQYPEGASVYGALDMVGNVAEWCLTEYDTYSDDITKIAERRVLRGGSWRDSPIFSANMTLRHYAAPDQRENWIGFRLCLQDPAIALLR